MGKKLTDINKQNIKTAPSPLTDRRSKLFKIAIEDKLDNKYCFKQLRRNDNKKFQNFISQTLGKGLTISQVEKLFLRTRGPTETQNINGVDCEIIHFGKDRSPFRIHGYYNQLGYFVLKKIDPKHKVHK